jgi:hypothetical protein
MLKSACIEKLSQLLEIVHFPDGPVLGIIALKLPEIIAAAATTAIETVVNIAVFHRLMAFRTKPAIAYT